MPMARIQVLVQLDDDLLSLLDERAAAAGVSRSEMVRRGVRAVIASDVESKLDKAIVEGYKRLPPPFPDASVERLAVASIEEEPW
jgi:metal-responsive CopG/Arc/MetJ family transcriptional regulator